MIRLISKAKFPLPIRTGDVQTIKRRRITRRRDGTSGVRAENVRSQHTIQVNPGFGAAITGPDSWAHLPDVKSYRKRGWLIIQTVSTVPAVKVASKRAKKGR